MSPEASRYTAHLDLRGVNDTHIQAIGRVPANSRVLDLGLADGSVAAMLGEMGCTVSGVEIDPVAAEAAKEVCRGEVVIADLNTFDFAERFAGQEFDVVLMLDVLEHLTDPAVVLNRVGSVLGEGGWGIVSLPNVAHVSVRLSLLNGHFTYTDMGLLDRTHLRFFDRAGVDDLFSQAGWGMFDLSRVTRRLGTTEIQLEDADEELVRQIEADTEGLTYQFVVSAAPLGSAVLDKPPPLPAAVAQKLLLEAQTRILELDAEVRELRNAYKPELLLTAEERVRELDAEVLALRQVHVPDLMGQLEAIRGSSVVRRGHLRHLLAAMQETSQRLHDGLSGT